MIPCTYSNCSVDSGISVSNCPNPKIVLSGDRNSWLTVNIVSTQINYMFKKSSLLEETKTLFAWDASSTLFIWSRNFSWDKSLMKKEKYFVPFA